MILFLAGMAVGYTVALAFSYWSTGRIVGKAVVEVWLYLEQKKGNQSDYIPPSVRSPYGTVPKPPEPVKVPLRPGH
jgi:hypothetical protein